MKYTVYLYIGAGGTVDVAGRRYPYTYIYKKLRVDHYIYLIRKYIRSSLCKILKSIFSTNVYKN